MDEDIQAWGDSDLATLRKHIKGGSPSPFARNLRAARLARRLTVRALGARVGVTGAAISKYEMGKSYPASSVLVALARAVEVPVECLMSEACHLPASAPKVRPPKTRIDRARRWSALWKRKAREERAAARFNANAYRAARADARAQRARAEAAEATARRVAALLDAGLRARGGGCGDAWHFVEAAREQLREASE